MTKITTKQVAIMGVIAILGMGITTAFATHPSLQPLSLHPTLNEVIDKVDELIAWVILERIENREAMFQTHVHTAMGGTFFEGEVLNDTRTSVFCEDDEIVVGGGYLINDPAISIVGEELFHESTGHDQEQYDVRMSGIVSVSTLEILVHANCMPLP